MQTDLALMTLLHILVFVYWLGGDLGAFYSSRFVTDTSKSVPARLLAAKILGDIDMAPRTCLLLALPTGLALANAKGWIAINGMWIVTAFAVAAIWIFTLFHLHRSTAPQNGLKAVDKGARILFLVGLSGVAAAGLLKWTALPLFLSLKALLLAFCILMGLLIRQMLIPFGAAFGKLVAEGASPDVDETLRASLGRARPFVLTIWVALLLAAWLGLRTPV